MNNNKKIPEWLPEWLYEDGEIAPPIYIDYIDDAEETEASGDGETLTIEVSTHPEYWGGDDEEVPEALLNAFADFLLRKAVEWGYYNARVTFVDGVERNDDERARELLKFAWSEFFNSGLADLYG